MVKRTRNGTLIEWADGERKSFSWIRFLAIISICAALGAAVGILMLGCDGGDDPWEEQVDSDFEAVEEYVPAPEYVPSDEPLGTTDAPAVEEATAAPEATEEPAIQPEEK